MSKSGILDALRNEARSLKSQLVAVQRAIEAIEGNAEPVAARGSRKSARAVTRRKRTNDRGAAPGRCRADAQVLGLAPRGEGAERKAGGVTMPPPTAPPPALRVLPRSTGAQAADRAAGPASPRPIDLGPDCPAAIGPPRCRTPARMVPFTTLTDKAARKCFGRSWPRIERRERRRWPISRKTTVAKALGVLAALRQRHRPRSTPRHHRSRREEVRRGRRLVRPCRHRRAPRRAHAGLMRSRGRCRHQPARE